MNQYAACISSLKRIPFTTLPSILQSQHPRARFPWLILPNILIPFSRLGHSIEHIRSSLLLLLSDGGGSSIVESDSVVKSCSDLRIEAERRVPAGGSRIPSRRSASYHIYTPVQNFLLPENAQVTRNY
jgi:hypothetical protein